MIICLSLYDSRMEKTNDIHITAHLMPMVLKKTLKIIIPLERTGDTKWCKGERTCNFYYTGYNYKAN